jgi:hypothetical protein
MLCGEGNKRPHAAFEGSKGQRRIYHIVGYKMCNEKNPLSPEIFNTNIQKLMKNSACHCFFLKASD